MNIGEREHRVARGESRRRVQGRSGDSRGTKWMHSSTPSCASCTNRAAL